MGVVLDASAVVELILGTRIARAIQQRLADAEAIHAPALVDTETLIVLRRYDLRGELPPDRAREALVRYRRLPVRLHHLRPLIDRAWALRRNFTPPDAFYVALAERLRVPLLTADARLARATRRHTEVDVLAP